MIRKYFNLMLVITSLFFSVFIYAQNVDKVYDPLEPYNRAVFKFNDRFDVYVAEPVAEGYDWVLPKRVITGVSNFFYNIRYPSRLVSDIIQLKFDQALDHTGQFLVNSTFGLAGFIDVASDMGIKRHDEDFGTALAYWGVGPGHYMVLPFIGPRNFRDTVGLMVDTVLNPIFWFSYVDFTGETWNLGLSMAVTSLEFINTRAELLETIKTAKESALDYYLFMQTAYYQHRNGVIFDGNAPGQGDEWLEEEDDFDLESE